MTEKLLPFRPISPGEILNEELEARGWTQSKFAEIIGVPFQVVNEIIIFEKVIDAATAVKLSRAIGNSSQFWLNLESSYRRDLKLVSRETSLQASQSAQAAQKTP